MSDKINLVNGNIITLDPLCPIAETISIDGKKIAGINSIDHNCGTIDLKGATVIPGFVDSHFHLVNLGKQKDTLNLRDCKSASEIAEKVFNKSKEVGSSDWIFGFGWDHTKWDDANFPDSSILDNLNISQPVMLTRIDGHACWVNARSMQLSGLDVSINPPEGGDIINSCILIDNAMDPIQFILPKPGEDKIKQWIKLALNIIIPRGITNIHDAWQDPTTVKVLKELANKEELPIRVYGMLGSSHSKLLKEFFKEGHYFLNNYTIRSVKAFIDGALGSRGAALLEPYSDDKNNCGLVLIPSEKFEKLAKLCKENNFQLCTHAIGDKGNRMVLNTYLETNKNINNHRWRIEHAQMVCDEDIPLFAKSGIVPSMQPSHCTSDMPWLHERLGKKRIHRISRWQSFINAGCQIPGGSDCPIEEGNPLFEYYAAVTRQDHQGLPINGWQNQEAISRTSALKMFTCWAAYGEFAEHRRGKIYPGFDADLTVLSQDITACNSKNILTTEILATIVNGNIIYNKL